MTLATAHTRAQVGVEAPPVRVEACCGPGLPQFTLVGLAETAVRESRDRVRAAILNSGFDFPAGRITVNLSPADLPKEGGRYDLAVAVGILAASGQVPEPALAQAEFYGELSLSGELRHVRGLLAAAVQATRAGRPMVVPAACAAEARMAPGVAVHPARSLLELAAALRTRGRLHYEAARPAPPPGDARQVPDLADVRGQETAKRAVEVAAAGAHGLLFIGPPGAGKSMLAQRVPGLLPPLTDAEAIETATIHSVSRDSPPFERWRERPFRAPHHSASAAAVVGGGARPLPGEASLAHHGVLFLDELPEFNRAVLESLREPLETGTVSIARARYRVTYPARFQLVAAMNACPCGHAGDESGRCRCTPAQVQRYLAKLSGPLIDRIDLHVPVRAVDYARLREAAPGTGGTSQAAARVSRARERQCARGGLNAVLPLPEIEAACGLGDREHELLGSAAARLGLSARACHRALRVARTIADLDGAGRVGPGQLAEALGYRCLDRLGGGPGTGPAVPWGIRCPAGEGGLDGRAQRTWSSM